MVQPDVQLCPCLESHKIPMYLHVDGLVAGNLEVENLERMSVKFCGSELYAL